MADVQSNQPRVGDIWYRYEDKSYSVSDEYGEHAYSRLVIELWCSTVIRVTPKGVWIIPGKEVHEDAFSRLYKSGETKKFICHGWTKKYACATKLEALESLKARRLRQQQIYEARARAAGEVLFQLDLQRKELLDKEGY